MAQVKPQVIDDEEHERVYERVAAVDVAKDSGMVCTRTPHRSRPGGPLHRITEFADTHPLLAVYPTLQRAIKADYPSHPAIARRPGGHHHLIAI